MAKVARSKERVKVPSMISTDIFFGGGGGGGMGREKEKLIGFLKHRQIQKMNICRSYDWSFTSAC